MDQSISNKLLGTQQQYQQMYLHLEDFGGKGITLQSITPVFADDFKSYLLSRIKPSTASIYFGLLKAVMAMAIRKEIILKNPCAGISIKVPESLPKYLTIEEVHRLVVTDCSNVEVKNAFLFSVMTGLRLSDIIRLQWSMIESNRIVIQQKKTGRVVVIPLSGYALGVLDQLQHNTPFVFHLPPYGTLKYILRNWVKAAGITKRVTFHCARHTFGTLLLNSGVDIYVLSQLMGHVSISMTTRYAKLLSPRKVEAIALFPDINKNLAL
jgi:integrase